MSSTPANDVASPEDFKFFIEELKKLLEEAPRGYQGKLAHAIADLQQQKLVKLARIREVLPRKPGEQINYEVLLHTLLREINDPTSSMSERFDAAFKVAQLRAQKSSEKPSIEKKL